MEITTSLRILLSETIDYAGLFPPAKLSMKDSVSNYARYKRGPYSWMLSRFIVPSSRFEEFLDEAESVVSDCDKPWQISMILDEDIETSIKKARRLNQQESLFKCDVFEIRVESVWAIEEVSETIPDDFTIYFEIPVEENLTELVSSISLYKRRAKIRTGGVTKDAFPTADQIVKFMRACLAANVPFKATAGLHHPLRSENRLTYEPDAPVGKMFGFLNVFVAAAFARNSLRPSLLLQILEEETLDNFTFAEDGIYWRQEHFVDNWHLRELREKAIISFGSCSFEEPVEGLRKLRLIE
ncbi:MAG: hypothetical protein RML33_07885 [Acidobacteriota bacterium]|nr:hypothetical protein [Pyrinomonadaceae bacterium]MDW8304739.1 hypothetical protein [Acidobacteriota bacterium]